MNTQSASKQSITPKSQDLSGWYNEVILAAQLADYAPVKGCMVIRPYGYAIWEFVQEYLGGLIKKGGVQNAYFPLFIPESYLRKEKQHVEGFSPELAVVTIGGGEELKEKLVVRPTSETMMYAMYAKWVKSHRDLPLLINQWNNVVRWEKRTYMFLRTTEFLWQEGHTVHKDEEGAVEFALKALDWYRVTYENLYALPGIIGTKSEQERFAGAKKTWTIELLMPDGKALQACTSHNLGDNFSKAFDIQYQDSDGSNKYAWQTSWGFSTRSIGGLIMSHGDDKGLVLPPGLAPIQAVIVPIIKNQEAGSKNHGEYVDTLYRALKNAGIRVHLDDREGYSPGRKFNEWELKGVPIRIEVGQREVEEGVVTIARRDSGAKLKVLPLSGTKLKTEVDSILRDIQKNLFKKAKKFLEDNTHTVDSYDEFKEIMKTKKGFIKAMWCENAACEKKIKEETKASTRVLPLNAKEEKGVCIYCGKEAHHRWYFGQSY